MSCYFFDAVLAMEGNVNVVLPIETWLHVHEAVVRLRVHCAITIYRQITLMIIRPSLFAAGRSDGIYAIRDPGRCQGLGK